MNDNAAATKKDVKEIVTTVVLEAVDTIMKGMSSLFDEVYKRLDRVEADVSDLKHDMGSVRSTLQDVHRRVIDLERDTPAQVDVDKLTKRVDRLERVTGIAS